MLSAAWAPTASAPWRARRAGDDVVHVGVALGVVTVVAAWMLDAAACAGVEIGAPRVAAPALTDLHRLLATLGFRTDSQGDSTVALGSSDEINTAEGAAVTAADDNGAGRQKPAGDDDGRTRGRGRRSGAALLEAAGTSAGRAAMTTADALPSSVLRRRAVVYVRHPASRRCRPISKATGRNTCQSAWNKDPRSASKRDPLPMCMDAACRPGAVGVGARGSIRILC